MSTGLNRELNQSLKDIHGKTKSLMGLVGSENRGIMDQLKAIESSVHNLISTNQKVDCLANADVNQSELVTIDLKKLVERAVASINDEKKKASEYPDRGINFKTYLRPVAPVKGNPDEIQNAIHHVIMNAVEAIRDKGDIYLTTEENAGYAYVYIQDSGKGISGEIIDRIFDPFFTTKGNDCAGLGLSLSDAIIKRHGGKMSTS